MVGKRQDIFCPLVHFCINIRGSYISERSQGRGGSTALRETTRPWSFHRMGGDHRPSASLCGNAFGFVGEGGIPGRCFRKTRRRPRAPSKLSSQKQKSNLRENGKRQDIFRGGPEDKKTAGGFFGRLSFRGRAALGHAISYPIPVS